MACAKVMVKDAIKLGMKDRFGNNSVTSHFWGALGEIAFARYIGEEWECHSKDGARPDVGRYEVRAIEPDKGIYLKAKKNDPYDRPIAFVAHLVGGTPMRERGAKSAALILGWTLAGTIKEIGKLEDWGGRNAFAYMLRDASVLSRVFPELEGV